MRLLLVRRTAGGRAYRGMDRPWAAHRGRFGSPVPSVFLDLAAAAHLPVDRQVEAHVRVLRVLEEQEPGGHDLLALDGVPRTEVGTWRWLGHDVGERSDRAWSALAHAEGFLSAAERVALRAEVNESGLFPTAGIATAFLRRYLDHDDPDRGWGPEGWRDDAADYGVVQVHVLNGVTAGARDRSDHP